MTESARILVVDDEPHMRAACSRLLEAEGYAVATAEDGTAGLARAREDGPFAAALVDLRMPHMDGLTLVRKLRELDQDIVLLVITAYATIDHAIAATRQGAFGFLPKPFTAEELYLSLRQGLHQRQLAIDARGLRMERDRRLVDLAEERSRCSTIIDCMSDGVIVVNREQHVVLTNAAVGRLLPGSAGVQLPAPLDVLGCPELSGFLAGMLAPDGVVVLASREISVDSRTCVVNASPIRSRDGDRSARGGRSADGSGADDRLGAVAVVRDITALKDLQEAKSMFVSMVAHEIKSPLAAVEGLLMAIQNEDPPGDTVGARQMLERAVMRCQALRSMVTELLQLMVIETGRFELRRVPVRLPEILARVMAEHAEHAADGRIELSCDPAVEAGASKVLADEDALRCVLSNLIDNAIKYTPGGGHVHLTVVRRPKTVQIIVRDDGVGMTPEEQVRVFDEFFRVRNAQTLLVPGTGLGLPLARRLVELHDGRIDVESSPGRGSSFIVTLPAQEVGDHSSAAVAAST